MSSPMLSFHLFAEADTMGALNLYSKQRSAFDDEAVAIGSVFATHPANGWPRARRPTSRVPPGAPGRCDEPSPIGHG